MNDSCQPSAFSYQLVLSVIPANAGIHLFNKWTPACAGVTIQEKKLTAES
jgi:hypothetical protein